MKKALFVFAVLMMSNVTPMVLAAEVDEPSFDNQREVIVQPDTDESASSDDVSLDTVIEKQNQILSELAAIRAELQIIKVRASQS